MEQKKTSKPYSPEFRERAVRLLMEHRDEYRSGAAAMVAIAGKLGCSPDSLAAAPTKPVRAARQGDGGGREDGRQPSRARIGAPCSQKIASVTNSAVRNDP